MKVREVIKKLEDDGWYLARTRGDHRQFKHPTKPNVVTVAGKLGVDMPIGTLKEIWRKAGLKEQIYEVCSYYRKGRFKLWCLRA